MPSPAAASTISEQRREILRAQAAWQEKIRGARNNLAAFIEVVGRDENGDRIQLDLIHKAWVVHVNYAWSNGKHAMIMAPFNSGKCQPAHSPVQMADGRIEQIGKLNGLVTSVIAYDEAWGRFAPAWAKVFDNGDRRVIRLRLRSGREIEVTEEHPFLTVDGWARAADLNPGAFVGVANNLPGMGYQALRDGEAELLGFLIGDGSLTHGNVSFTSGDEENLAAAAEAATKLGFRSMRFNSGYRTPGIRLAGGDVRPWLRHCGIAGHSSRTKTTPTRIFTAPPAQVARYIGAYFACDGHVDAKGNVELYSVNRPLLDDVRSLLLRFGVVSRVMPKRGRYKGQVHASWRLRVLRPFLQIFRDRIPVPGAKGRAVAKIVPRTTGRLSNGDLIPLAYRRHLIRTAHWHKTHTGVSLDQAAHRGRRHLGTARDVVRAAAEAEKNQHLLLMTGPQIFWDEIVGVDEMGIQRTYGMEVDDHHTYLSGDVIVHNTSTLAIPLVAYLIGQNPQIRIKIVCADDDMAKLRVASTKSIIESYEYKKIFPGIRPGKKWDVHDAFVDRVGHAHDPTLQARGVLTEGIGSRCDVLVFDDICTQKNSEEEAMRAKVKKRGRGTWMSRLDGPEARAMAFGTAWAQDDLTSELKQDPKWITLVQAVEVPGMESYDQTVWGAPDVLAAYPGALAAAAA